MNRGDLTTLMTWTGIGLSLAWSVTIYVLAWVRRDADEAAFWETYDD